MATYEYRKHNEPGCGGCLLFFLLLILLTGGAPLLFRVLGIILSFGVFALAAAFAAFLGISYFVRRQVSTYEASQTETHNRFVSLLVHILVKIAQIDGSVSREELRTIRRFFQVHLHYSQSQLFWVKDLIKEAMESTTELESLLDEFRKTFAYEPRLLLLDLIYQVLFSNTAVKESELQQVRNIARYLEITLIDQRIAEAKYTGGYGRAAPREREAGKEKKSFEFLGLEQGAPFTEIKSAYRKLSMKYHPDKVRHLGEEFRVVAEEKMKALNDAYEFLEKKYGR